MSLPFTLNNWLEHPIDYLLFCSITFFCVLYGWLVNADVSIITLIILGRFFSNLSLVAVTWYFFCERLQNLLALICIEKYKDSYEPELCAALVASWPSDSISTKLRYMEPGKYGYGWLFSDHRYTILICNQLPRPTRPHTVNRIGNEYQPKCVDAYSTSGLNVWVAGISVWSVVNICGTGAS